MKSKVRNKNLGWKMFNSKGFQLLTGKQCVRANDVPCGICYVEQDNELAHPYARGKRVVLKVYVGRGKDYRIDDQINPELQEVCLWIPLEDFKKMMELDIKESLSGGLMTI